jgi:uncharacterized protein YbaR (Trm112 family)
MMRWRALDDVLLHDLPLSLPCWMPIMDTRLIQLLVCPVCKGPLQRTTDGAHLLCMADRLAFPIRDGIPVMLEGEALPLDEHDQPITGATTGQEL